jgi:predicted NBD/HSP70 family sugar kinase
MNTPWPAWHDAHRDVLRELIIHGPRPRVQIAAKLHLSRPSLTRLGKELIDFGFVAEGALRYSASRGRPAELLEVRPDAAAMVGVKLTGDHLWAVLTDLTTTVQAQMDREIDSKDPASVVELIATVVESLLDGVDVPSALGVCLAGDVYERDGGQTVAGAGFLNWPPTPLQLRLKERLGLPVIVSNDVAALTSGIHWFGNGAGVNDMVLVVVGAGVGSGLVIHGIPVGGTHGRAGHVGHIRIDGDGAPCRYGHRDCIHSFVTMPAVAMNAGTGSDYELALDRARNGDERARKAFRLAARALGAGVAESVNAVDPRKVFVTGEGTDMLDLEYDLPLRGGDFSIMFYRGTKRYEFR